MTEKTNHNAHFQRGILFLRLALAFTFAYAAIGAFFQPTNWVVYLPPFLGDRAMLVLQLTGLAQIVLAIWLIWGKRLFWAASLSTLMLFGITAANFALMDIVSREVGPCLAALGLMARSCPWPNCKSSQNPADKDE